MSMSSSTALGEIGSDAGKIVSGGAVVQGIPIGWLIGGAIAIVALFLLLRK